MALQISTPSPPSSAACRRLASELYVRLLGGLTHLGFTHTNVDGQAAPVRIAAIDVIRSGPNRERAYACFRIDMHHLPHGVTAAKLQHDHTLAHLRAVCGFDVGVNVESGLTYVVKLFRETDVPELVRSARIPRQVLFNLADAPGDKVPSIAIGHDANGPVWLPLKRTGHILIVGTTGAGKTTSIHVLIASLAATCTPSQLQLVFLDPKGNEASIWHGLPHLRVAPSTDTGEMLRQLTGVVMEMERRSELFRACAVRSYEGYCELVARGQESPLPQIVVIIDEFVDLMQRLGMYSTFAKTLNRLVNMANAYGITVVLSATNPRGDIINGIVRDNCPIRLVFALSEGKLARELLGQGGAEKIERDQRGRMLARLTHGVQEIQGYWIPDEQLREISNHLRAGPVQRKQSLSALELQLVRIAHEQLGGAFPINQLWKLSNKAAPHHEIAEIGRRFELRGWLSKPAHATDSRKLLPALLAEMQQCLQPHHTVAINERGDFADGNKSL